MDSNAKIIVGCQAMCGIGRMKPFVIVNHIPVIAETKEELLKKVKEQIKE
jgi:uncharacterized protein YuzB (UPF0349 family)